MKAIKKAKRTRGNWSVWAIHLKFPPAEGDIFLNFNEEPIKSSLTPRQESLIRNMKEYIDTNFLKKVSGNKIESKPTFFQTINLTNEPNVDDSNKTDISSSDETDIVNLTSGTSIVNFDETGIVNLTNDPNIVNLTNDPNIVDLTNKPNSVNSNDANVINFADEKTSSYVNNQSYFDSFDQNDDDDEFIFDSDFIVDSDWSNGQTPFEFIDFL